MDLDERHARQARAEALLPGLAEKGVVAVATSFVDNSGISRVKSVPLARLPRLASWGVGFSTAFDYFRFDDWVAAPASGEGPIGDQRIVPDLSRLVVLPAQPGWAWAPGDRFAQDGEPHDQDSRLLLTRLVADAAESGLGFSCAFEIEWVVSEGAGDTFEAATRGPGYGLARLAETSDYARDVIVALDQAGVVVEQFHPEYAAGQLELSVAPEDPVAAADTSVLVRHVVRAVGQRHGLRTSYSPKVDTSGVGNGGHVHLSAWRDGHNLMSGGPERFGLTGEGAGLTAGVLEHLPGLLALGAPGVASYLRLVPQHWAGAYRCWGLENREASLRLVTGSAGQESSSANLEVKCFDLHANPYLVLAGLLVAGAAGMDAGHTLPEPVQVDPASLTDDELGRRGIERLPLTLRASLEAFVGDDTLTTAFGPALVGGLVAVRESELELFADATPEQVADATRWAH